MLKVCAMVSWSVLAYVKVGGGVATAADVRIAGAKDGIKGYSYQPQDLAG